jgi:hypothetical protein
VTEDVALYIKSSGWQRKRHYWKLDANAITLYKDESTSRYYKVGNIRSCFYRLLWIYMLSLLLSMNKLKLLNNTIVVPNLVTFKHSNALRSFMGVAG